VTSFHHWLFGLPDKDAPTSRLPSAPARAVTRDHTLAVRSLNGKAPNPASEPQSEANLNVPWRTYGSRDGSNPRLTDRRTR
jgi:hypothetical protein